MSASGTTVDATFTSNGSNFIAESDLSGAIDISTYDGAISALKNLDYGIDRVNSVMTSIGAYQNRFERSMDFNKSYATSAEASEARIIDADYAQETSNLSRAQILQQAATAMIAQANMQPQTVSALLKNI